MTRIATVLLALALVSAGCGSGSDDDQPLPEPPTTAAADLRAALEVLFREHVFLLGLASEDAVTGQVKGFEAAAEALEENTLAIGERFETAYGTRGEKGFLTVWRPYADLVTNYATLVRRNPKIAKAAQVDRSFGKAAGKVAAFAGGITPLIGPRIIGSRMRDLIALMRAAADAQVAKDYKKADASLRTAADRAGDIAAIFARAFADDLPAIYRGDPLSPASALRSALIARLVDHVYLAGFTAENILTDQSKPRDGAKAALDATTTALATLIGGTYGAAAERSFLPVWRRGVDLLLAYPGAAKDKAKREKVRRDLAQYATDAAAFLKGLNSDLDAPALERILGDHATAMTAAFDSLAAGDFKKGDTGLRAAAGGIEALAGALATAAVQRFPARFRVRAAGPSPRSFVR